GKLTASRVDITDRGRRRRGEEAAEVGQSERKKEYGRRNE
ncbi:hypothetical protein A2U01_0118951, partial [Trifolium medium]|nr:hypothetical protein [Trifolium medium]